jgi:hypothetical protein
MKHIFVISFISLQLTACASVVKYRGLDGDNESCYFEYDSKSKKARLDLYEFSFRPMKMTIKKQSLVGKIRHSKYSIVAESETGTTNHQIINSLNLVTVLENHGDHNHVWSCHHLEKY